MKVKSENAQLLSRIGRLLCILLMLLMLLYGCWLLILQGVLSSELRAAKQNYTAVTVQITEIKPQEHNPFWCVVTLEPPQDSDDTETKDNPIELGKTRANALKFKLFVGKKLTMYYDESITVERIVDFENSQYLIYLGVILTALPLLTVLLLAIRKLLHKTKKRPIVQIASEHHE